MGAFIRGLSWMFLSGLSVKLRVSMYEFNKIIQKLLVSLSHLLFFKKKLNLAYHVLRKPTAFLFVRLPQIVLVP
jgi:hypothetical protein